MPKEKRETESRFNNRRTKCAMGYNHRSLAEAALCAELRWQVKAGALSNIRHEVTVRLSDAEIRYIADWVVFDCALQCDVWYEFKGKEMARWPTIKRLWKHYGPGKLRIFKGSAEKFRMVQEINPE